MNKGFGVKRFELSETYHLIKSSKSTWVQGSSAAPQNDVGLEVRRLERRETPICAKHSRVKLRLLEHLDLLLDDF